MDKPECLVASMNNHMWHAKPTSSCESTYHGTTAYKDCEPFGDRAFINCETTMLWKFYQGDSYAQTWYNCNTAAPDGNGTFPNVIFALKYYTPTQEGGWGHGYYYEPNVYTSPENVSFAMRCEFYGMPAVNCLCPNISAEPAEMCDYVLRDKNEPTFGVRDYTGNKCCYKLNMIIHKPIHSSSYEHTDCDSGLFCKRNDTESETGTCSPCFNKMTCPDKTFSPALSNWSTCYYGQPSCLDECALYSQECSTDKPCCLGVKCEGGWCVNDNCKKTGTCTDDNDCCANYGCLNSTVVYAEEQECYSTNNIASPNCTDGTLCNVETDTCFRATGRKQVIYYPWLHMGCKVPADCDVGLDCMLGMCYNCPNDKCSEKQKQNVPTCLYGENNCPDKCAHPNGACGGKDWLSCYRGLKCDNQNGGGGICIDDPCKRNGKCINDDDDISTNYGCVTGKVMCAAGLNCTTTANCTGGTVCTKGHSQNISIIPPV